MSEYDQQKRRLQLEWGDRLGAFICNRMARMIKRRAATCLSHERVSVGDSGLDEYEEIRRSGCCGFADDEFEFIDDAGAFLTVRIGFCYGH